MYLIKEVFRRVRESIPMREAARICGVEANRAGMALCPFHDDHNPSLRLYDDHYYCFGCHAHGDAVDLAAFVTGLRPGLAAKFLAREAGIDTGDSQGAASRRPEAQRKEAGTTK